MTTRHELIRSARTFRVWSYAIGHRTLYLRSAKSEEGGTTIDIGFASVYEMHLPTELQGIAIHEEITDDGPATQPRKWIVETGDVIGHVIAGAAGVHEDDREWFDFSYGDDARRLMPGPAYARVRWLDEERAKSLTRRQTLAWRLARFKGLESSRPRESWPVEVTPVLWPTDREDGFATLGIQTDDAALRALLTRGLDFELYEGDTRLAIGRVI